MVVHGEAGMDEIAPNGATRVWEVRDGSVAERTIRPEELGVDPVPLDDLRGGAPADNATRIEGLLRDPERDPAGRAATVLNAGAALYVAGRAESLAAGVKDAVGVLGAGGGMEVVEALRRASRVPSSGG
jgi:anthranilate phosphoribosyltransferase